MHMSKKNALHNESSVFQIGQYWIYIPNIHQPSLILPFFGEDIGLGGKYRIGDVANLNHKMQFILTAPTGYSISPAYQSAQCHPKASQS